MSDDEYDVGYGKPPKNGQFRKGRSGNPRGRPRGKKNRRRAHDDYQAYSVFLEQAQRLVKIKEDGEVRSVGRHQAIVQSLMTTALKGDFRAQKVVVETYEKAAAEVASKRTAFINLVFSYQTNLRSWIKENEKVGLPPPDYIIDPDDIRGDPATDTWWIRGPVTEQQKESLEWLRMQRAGHRKDYDDATADLRRATDPEDIMTLEDIRDSAKVRLDMIDPPVIDYEAWKRVRLPGDHD